MPMLQIECSGTPYEIGYKHGSLAARQISRTIAFYADLFLETSRRTWLQVLEIAKPFDAEIRDKWPRYHEELRGIAAGSQRELLDIIAINVRSEIAFGLFSDGCTSLYWRTNNSTFLGQNWDWQLAQKENLILLTIHQPTLPSIKMVTEAGLMGKIGLNSAGVGVCFNAIRAKGMDSTRLPCHLGLRMALESMSTISAVRELQRWGMASSAHILIGDVDDATGLEFTNSTFWGLKPDQQGVVVHSNHLVGKHEGAVEPEWLRDSTVRIERMKELANEVERGDTEQDEFAKLFEDEKGFPVSICRGEGEHGISTLFNIVMTLNQKHAVVKVGRPTEPEEVIELTF